MTRHALAAVAALLLTAAVGQAQAPRPPVLTHQAAHQAPVFKHANVDTAWKAAQKSHRPLLLFVSSENCKYCTKMLRDTYAHPQIAAALAASCEPVSLMREDNLALVEKLQIKAFPTTVIVGSDGRELARVEGYQPPQKFAELMFRPPTAPQAVVRPASVTAAAR